MNTIDIAKEFLEKNGVKNYMINPDGTVDVDDDITILAHGKLPVKFGRVNGYFECGCQLTSLEGVPSYVGRFFYCVANHLTSLHDVHKIIKEIDGDFYCRSNPIKDSVLGLFLIKGIKKVHLDNSQVQYILNKHLGQGRAGVIDAQQELLDAGLDEYARL